MPFLPPVLHFLLVFCLFLPRNPCLLPHPPNWRLFHAYHITLISPRPRSVPVLCSSSYQHLFFLCLAWRSSFVPQTKCRSQRFTTIVSSALYFSNAQSADYSRGPGGLELRAAVSIFCQFSPGLRSGDKGMTFL